MPRKRRRNKTQPLYIVVARALERGWARAAGAAAGFWHDLTQARGSRYFRALAVFCVLCMLLGAGASLAWRTAAVQSAVTRYRAVFLGTGGGSPGESPALVPSGQATPAGGGSAAPPGGQSTTPPGGSAEPAGSGGSPAGPSIPAGSPGEPEVAGPDLNTLTRPLAGALLVDFGWQYSTTLEDWRFHPGVDIQAAEGTGVRAALAGKVVHVLETFEYGLTVRIDHGAGYATVYGQLKSSSVKAGDVVSQGAQIGIVGSPAGIELEDGPHLHFELLSGQEALNPQDYWD